MNQVSNRRELREDRALAKGLRAGKPRAWTQFYAVYATPLFRFALTRVNSQEDIAADIAQDTIVVAMERIATFNAKKGSLWGWLCGIAVNKSHESLRSQKRVHDLKERIEENPIIDAETPMAENLDTPEILGTMAQLNPRFQEVLQLKYVDECSVKEMAQQLELSDKAVESRLSRAREAFRKVHQEPNEVMTQGEAQ